MVLFTSSGALICGLGDSDISFGQAAGHGKVPRPLCRPDRLDAITRLSGDDFGNTVCSSSLGVYIYTLQAWYNVIHFGKCTFF